ncbi:hypothetical protein I302_104139 [Kwoniella bestiolae CBS 10118]|uniref:SET domain-containing protein n=1 Tax=Kwoniella bestiolae CBS 10118 TaxID=1296100 RepID=A0A1B9GAE9_9TREE|nr:hypothetical protein I302_02847 [Kwoniella bestiolae CBS 10118]OCF27997.1 hypothetical protein I302_02847 [Kwoniella bestiolae CBS 10118]
MLNLERTTTTSSSSLSSTSSGEVFVPLTDKTLDLTITILHQICAHEHVFQEFFATLDRTVKPPIRATMRLYYDRKGLFVNPHTGSLARREDDEVILREMIEKITDVQRDSAENLIPEYWLEKIEQNFLKALSNTQIHLRSVAELSNQVGLFVKPAAPPTTTPQSRKRKRKARQNTSKYKGEISVSGIEFILIAFPTPLQKPRKLGFNCDLMFDDWQGEMQYTCLGLGMARVINHRCSDNVVWRFPKDGMEFNTGVAGVGCMVGQFQKQKKIVWGEQLFAFYSKGFAKKKCQCPNKRYHGKRPPPPPSSSGSTRSISFELRTPDSASEGESSPTTEKARCRKSTKHQSLMNLQVPLHEAEKKRPEDPDEDDLDSLRSTSNSPPPPKRATVILSPESDEGDTNAFDQLATVLSEGPNLVTHALTEEQLQVKGSCWENPIEVDDDDDDDGGGLQVNVEDKDEGDGRLDFEEEVDDEFDGLESVSEAEWEEVVTKKERRVVVSRTREIHGAEAVEKSVSDEEGGGSVGSGGENDHDNEGLEAVSEHEWEEVVSKKQERWRVVVSISPEMDAVEELGQSFSSDENEIQFIKVVKKSRESVRADKLRTIPQKRADRSTASMIRDAPSFLNLPAADDLTRLKVTQREVTTCRREMSKVHHHFGRFERVVDGIKRDDRRYKRSETRWRMYLKKGA